MVEARTSVCGLCRYSAVANIRKQHLLITYINDTIRFDVSSNGRIFLSLGWLFWLDNFARFQAKQLTNRKINQETAAFNIGVAEAIKVKFCEFYASVLYEKTVWWKEGVMFNISFFRKRRMLDRSSFMWVEAIALAFFIWNRNSTWIWRTNFRYELTEKLLMRGSAISNQKWVSGCFSLTNQSQAFPNFEITILK